MWSGSSTAFANASRSNPPACMLTSPFSTTPIPWRQRLCPRRAMRRDLFPSLFEHGVGDDAHNGAASFIQRGSLRQQCPTACQIRLLREGRPQSARAGCCTRNCSNARLQCPRRGRPRSMRFRRMRGGCVVVERVQGGPWPKEQGGLQDVRTDFRRLVS